MRASSARTEQRHGIRQLAQRLTQRLRLLAGDAAAPGLPQHVGSFAMGAAPHLALMAERPPEQVIAISLVIACLGVARSPSSAIALVSELNAHGPFTTTALCITVLMDVVVVLLFAMTLLAVHTILPEPGQEPQPASTVIAIFGLRKSIEPPLSPISRRSI